MPTEFRNLTHHSADSQPFRRSVASASASQLEPRSAYAYDALRTVLLVGRPPRAAVCGLRCPLLMPKAPGKNGLFGWRRGKTIRKIAKSDSTRGLRDERGITGQVN